MVQSVSRTVKEILLGLAYLNFAFENQLVNESALARFIHKRVEEKTGKPVSRMAVIAAVRRFIVSSKPAVRSTTLTRFLKSFKIHIRTGMIEANFKRTPGVSKLISQTEKKTNWNSGERFYVLGRSQEITVVSNSEYFKKIVSRFDAKDVLSVHGDRAVITISFDPHLAQETFGALDYLTSVFAALGVSIHVVFTTYSENSFVIKEKDVPVVYKTLSQSMHEIDELHEG